METGRSSTQRLSDVYRVPNVRCNGAHLATSERNSECVLPAFASFRSVLQFSVPFVRSSVPVRFRRQPKTVRDWLSALIRAQRS